LHSSPGALPLSRRSQAGSPDAAQAEDDGS
jgi:hypothetical protein